MSGKRYTEEFKIAAVKQVARWYRWRQCHRNEPRLIIFVFRSCCKASCATDPPGSHA